MCDKCDGVITRVTSLSGIFLTLMFFALLQKDLFLGMRSLVEGFFKQNHCHACHTRFTLILLHKFTNIANYASSCPMELKNNKENTWKRQNHGFLSNKYISQALYKTFHTTIKNEQWKIVSLTSFQKKKKTISIHFDLLQVFPSWPNLVFAGLLVAYHF